VTGVRRCINLYYTWTTSGELGREKKAVEKREWEREQCERSWNDSAAHGRGSFQGSGNERKTRDFKMGKVEEQQQPNVITLQQVIIDPVKNL